MQRKWSWRWAWGLAALLLVLPLGAKIADEYRLYEDNANRRLEEAAQPLEAFAGNPDGGFRGSEASRGAGVVQSIYLQLRDKVSDDNAREPKDAKKGKRKYTESEYRDYLADITTRLDQVNRLKNLVERHVPAVAKAYQDVRSDYEADYNRMVQARQTLLTNLTTALAELAKNPADAEERIQKQLAALDRFHTAEAQFKEFEHCRGTRELAAAAAALDAAPAVTLTRDPWNKVTRALQKVANRAIGTDGPIGRARTYVAEKGKQFAAAGEATKLAQQETALRAKALACASLYPGIKDEKNKDYLLNADIRGQRVRISDGKPGSMYRILITKRQRNNTAMRDWLVAKAKQYSGGQVAFEKAFGAGQYQRALDRHVPENWQIHHHKPLYVGAENGGIDDGANYELIEKAVHKLQHMVNGATYKLWGPPGGLYRARDAQGVDLTDTDDAVEE